MEANDGGLESSVNFSRAFQKKNKPFSTWLPPGNPKLSFQKNHLKKRKKTRLRGRNLKTFTRLELLNIVRRILVQSRGIREFGYRIEI